MKHKEKEGLLPRGRNQVRFFDALCLTRNPKGGFSMRNLKKGASLATYSLMPLFDSMNTTLLNTYNALLGSIAPIFASIGGGATTTTGMGAAGGAGYYYKLVAGMFGL
jgi:hypothetical protein